MQDGGVGDAVVPPLVDVRLERVEDAGPAGGLDQQFFNAGGTGELVRGLAVQLQPAADLADRQALGEQGLHRGMPFPVAGDQTALTAAHVAEPVRLGWRGQPRGCW